MPQTITIEQTQYRWNELSQSAKENALIEYFSEYNWAEDALASLRGFAEHFGSRLDRWSIDWGDNSYSDCAFASVDCEPEELETLVKELRTDGGCQFTGYCIDDDCNDGAVKAYADGERDVMNILEAGFETWLKAAHADYEYQTSEEAIAENCESNDYWFDAKGNLV